MKLWKNALSVGLSLVLCVGMVTPSFAAVEYDIALGGLNVAKNDEGQTISWSEGHETYKDKTSAAVDNEIVVKQSNDVTEHTINVTGAAEGTTIVLSGVNIDASNTGTGEIKGTAAMTIDGAGTNVTVELDGENTLKSGTQSAGLELSNGGSVIIQDSDDNGSLNAIGNGNGAVRNNSGGGAGIGSAYRGNAGNITITGGTVTAQGGNATSIYSDGGSGAGAGIGGGASGTAGSITISGGAVTATGGKGEDAERSSGGGAGIGSGALSTVEDIVISGGTVIATGGDAGRGHSNGGYGAGAGIGTGNWGKANSITITGGTVAATGGKVGYGFNAGGAGCGIGNGNSGSLKYEITINGGTVKAIGTNNSGIGGSDVTINGGDVTAIGGEAVPGINVGSNIITINGGTVYAKGGKRGAGIGSASWAVNSGSIIINGGVVTAVSAEAAGIGYGHNISGVAKITINSSKAIVLALTTAGDSAIKVHSVNGDQVTFEEGGALSGTLADSATNENTAFVIVDKEGNVVREFNVFDDGTTYKSFAVSLPDGEYCILQQCENGSFIGYDANNSVVYTISSSNMLKKSNMKAVSSKVKYSFKSGTDDRELPEEVMKQLTTSYKSDFTEVKDEDGTWTFQGWNIGIPQIVDGKLQDVDAVGTWVYTVNPPTPVPPSTPTDTTPTGPNVFEGYDFGTGTTQIEDEAVPLAAGPVTRAEFIDYLWRHEGRPESDGVCTFTDVEADYEYILALAWAEQNGIIEANEDGTFEPDELVTVAAVRDILDNFARVFEMDVDVTALATLTGEDDEAVLNCDEVIAEFFGEETEEQEAA